MGARRNKEFRHPCLAIAVVYVVIVFGSGEIRSIRTVEAKSDPEISGSGILACPSLFEQGKGAGRSTLAASLPQPLASHGYILPVRRPTISATTSRPATPTPPRPARSARATPPPPSLPAQHHSPSLPARRRELVAAAVDRAIPAASSNAGASRHHHGNPPPPSLVDALWLIWLVREGLQQRRRRIRIRP
ncbi:hypothetical protein GQ55_8G080800 [Panicum hallii var. hallii]|uniref:Uncharacterized protein n=1 Tax=Panicum hallii var. hallii TaxID=1504633 RepID=A0A2T7CLZ9_9POAL|nr:hypothetical protein GQ55_8G080800 [Panicum hallii var. hallii]